MMESDDISCKLTEHNHTHTKKKDSLTIVFLQIAPSSMSKKKKTNLWELLEE